jgi:hypothetical protein
MTHRTGAGFTWVVTGLLLCSAVVLGCGPALTGTLAAPLASTASTLATYDVRSYGAQGDGLHDDASAIQQAMNAAASAGAGNVTFPCGEYALKSVAGAAPGGRSLLYLKESTNIQFTGQGHCSHLFTVMPEKTVLELEDSTTPAVSSMRISALNALYVETYGMDGGSAIRFSGVSYGTIAHVEVDGSSAGALYLTKGTTNSTVSQNFLHDTYGSGVWEDDCGAASSTTCAPNVSPSNNRYDSNTLTNTSMKMTTAMTLDDGGASTHATIIGNMISWNIPPIPGFEHVFCIQAGNVSDASILNNTCSGAFYDGIVITADTSHLSHGVIIQGNIITSPGASVAGGLGIVVYVDPTGGQIYDFVLSNNTISYSAGSGIQVVSAGKNGGAHDGQIINNTISLADQRTPGTTFGIDIQNSASIVAASNTISCNGSCIAAGVRVDQSSSSTPGVSANSVFNILGVPVQTY